MQKPENLKLSVAYYFCIMYALKVLLIVAVLLTFAT